MRKVQAGLAIAMGALLVSGCARSVYTDIKLTEVRRPEDVSQRWGDYKIEEAEKGLAYEDQLVRVLTVPSNGMFMLRIQNKTEHTLQLIWNQMSFVNVNGTAAPVSSGKTRMMNVGQSRPPTPIPAKASVQVTAIPNSIIQSTTVRPLFPASDSAQFNKWEGKEMRLIVPLKVQDTVNEYTFVFTVEELRVGNGQ